MLLPLGTLALWLALRTPRAKGRRGALAGYGLLGLVLGLALWTNLLAVVMGPPVATLLWLSTAGPPLRERVRRLRPALAIVPGFILGSLPHWVYGLRHGTAVPTVGVEEGVGRLGPHVTGLVLRGWPELAGSPAGSSTRSPAWSWACCWRWPTAPRWPAWSGRDPVARASRPLTLALVALVATNVGLALFTLYGDALAFDARYLLPLYVALPVLLAAGLSRIPARFGIPALAAILLSNWRVWRRASSGSSGRPRRDGTRKTGRAGGRRSRSSSAPG